jgi:hypothetical protein
VKKQDVEQLLAGKSIGTKLRLTFKEDYPRDMMYLYIMLSAGQLTTESIALKMNCYTIGTTGEWGHKDLRVADVALGEAFDLENFLQRIAWPLDSIEILP